MIPPPAAAAEADSHGYDARAIAIEPRGAEAVPLSERRGRPIQLLWTWSSPNLEFATIFVGFIAVASFRLSPLEALGAIVVGNGIAAVLHYVLSARGPRLGLPQMVLGRLAFGWWGNFIPAVISSCIAGTGWFAVNALSAAFALSALTGLNAWLSLLVVSVFQIGVAVFGYNLVQDVERYLFPLLAVTFAVVGAVVLMRGDIGASGHGGGLAGFTLSAAACFGYSAGWNPSAADYTRYYPPGRAVERSVGIYAATGLFATTTALEFVGAVAATLIPGSSGNYVGDFTDQLPAILGTLTLLAITLGGSAANVLNVYSAALSFLAIGIRVGRQYARAITSASFGAVGMVIAFASLSDAGAKYENFLLIVAYWLGPWLGVVFADMVIHRGRDDESVVADRTYVNWAGPIALMIGAVVSVWLFSNQAEYVGVVAERFPGLGDITLLVGFLLSAATFVALAGTRLGPNRPARVGLAARSPGWR